MKERVFIYLDNAATTLQKPQQVARKAAWAVNNLSSPGRGGHPAAMAAAEALFACRSEAAELFHVKNPENIIFTMNATHALNIALKSLTHRGDRVVISGYEHNSVTRPLYAIGARTEFATAELFEPEVAVYEFERRLTGGTTLAVCNHVSNVFGYIQPVQRIADICRERGIPFIVDASQSAGVIDIDFEALGAAFVAMPGHKGLYGPQGTGMLICSEPPASLIQGGTGSGSRLQSMPEFLPDRLEAGTHNMPGISGLAEGIKFVKKKSPGGILEHGRKLVSAAADGLKLMGNVRVFNDEHMSCQSGVLSFSVENMPCETVGEELSKRGIAVRTGLHCSPLAHGTAGTLGSGTVRISVSAFNTMREIHAFLNEVESITNPKRYKILI